MVHDTTELSFSPIFMPPTTRSEAGARPAAPLASSHSDGEGSPTLPGNASLDDNPVLALRRDLASQHAAHREEAADLQAAVVATTHLKQSMAVVPPAAPTIAGMS